MTLGFATFCGSTSNVFLPELSFMDLFASYTSDRCKNLMAMCEFAMASILIA